MFPGTESRAALKDKPKNFCRYSCLIFHLLQFSDLMTYKSENQSTIVPTTLANCFFKNNPRFIFVTHTFVMYHREIMELFGNPGDQLSFLVFILLE